MAGRQAGRCMRGVCWPRHEGVHVLGQGEGGRTSLAQGGGAHVLGQGGAHVLGQGGGRMSLAKGGVA